MTQMVASVSAGIGLEDDAPVAITDDDLAPTGEPAPERQAGIIPLIFQSEQLLEEEREGACSRVLHKVVERLGGELDPYGHLVHRHA